jgi:hypothetical protein
MANSYTESAPYEEFIIRAFKCERGTKYGADVSFMRNLIESEKGKVGPAYLAGTERQLLKLKEYLNNAIDKFLTRKIKDNQKQSLELLRPKIASAASSVELREIILEGLEITDNLK